MRDEIFAKYTEVENSTEKEIPQQLEKTKHPLRKKRIYSSLVAIDSASWLHSHCPPRLGQTRCSSPLAL